MGSFVLYGQRLFRSAAARMIAALPFLTLGEGVSCCLETAAADRMIARPFFSAVLGRRGIFVYHALLISAYCSNHING